MALNDQLDEELIVVDDDDHDDDDDRDASRINYKVGDIIFNEKELCTYFVDDFLGKGGFAECHAVHDRNKRKFALKIIKMKKLKKRDPDFIKIGREVQIQKDSTHENIVRLYGHFTTNRFYYLTLELCRTSTLLTVINQTNNGLSEDRSRFYLQGVLRAVEYLLNKDVLHRDIKPGNVMISFQDTVKLGDFGLAIQIKDIDKKSISGTPNYLAPEVLKCMGHSERSEVWALGCTLFCMLTKKPPFETEGIQETYQRIRHGRYDFPPFIRLSREVKEIIKQCLQTHPAKRPTIAELLESDWMTYGVKRRWQRSTTPQPEHTARSEDVATDVNDNIVQLPSVVIPAKMSRSEEDDDQRLVKRSKCSSDSGSASDSGFGSDIDVSKRLAIAADVNRILDDVRQLIDGKAHLKPTTLLPNGYVTKWVDYTNRNGFSVKLNDGSTVVKFNDGVCMSLDAELCQMLYSRSPFGSSRSSNVTEAFKDVSVRQYIEAVHQYRSFMDKDLAGLDPLLPEYSANLLVFQKSTAEFVIMVLSNGTIQINFLVDRIKIVLWLNGDINSECTKFAILNNKNVFVIEVNQNEEKSAQLEDHIDKAPATNLSREHIELLSNVCELVRNHCDFLHLNQLLAPVSEIECL